MIKSGGMKVKYFRFFLTFLSLGLLSISSFAADFRDVYPGARANAMGSAFTGVADDPYTIFYNPAGLATLKSVEVAGGIGRRFSERPACGEISFVYARPVPNRKSGVAGFGFYTFRQSGTASKDVFAFSWGDNVMLKRFQKPLSWGGNFKMISLRRPGKNRFALGVDAGVLLKSVKGLKTGLSLMNLNTGVGISLTTLNFGTSYKWKKTLFSMDFRQREGFSGIFPGVEHTILNGLLKVRAGKGLSFDKTSQLVLGLGADVLPFIVDTVMSLPWEGFHKQSGYYQFSVRYKFGSPHFSEAFVGQAAYRSETLKREISVLETRKRTLESSIATAQVNKGVLEADLRTLQMRLGDMKARLKSLELDILETQRYKEAPKPKKAPVLPVRKKWPKKHTVKAGDTLRSIASRYYGDSTFWETIYEVNHEKVSRGLPKVGSTLTIPSPPSKKR